MVKSTFDRQNLNQSPATVQQEQQITCPAKDCRNDLTTVFVKIQQSGQPKTVSLKVSAKSTTASDLCNLVLTQLGAPLSGIQRSAESAYITHQGRILPLKFDLKSQMIKNHSTLVLTCESLIGGSKSAQSDNEVDLEERKVGQHQTFVLEQSPNEKLVTEISQIEEKMQLIQEESPSDPQIQSGSTRGQSKNTTTSITNPLEQITTVPSNDLGSPTVDNLILDARSKLLASYQVPQINEQIEKIEDVLEIVKSQLESMLSGFAEIEHMNQQVLENFEQFDVERVGSLDFKGLHASIRYFLKDGNINLDENLTSALADIIDTNNDKRYSRDEIVQPYGLKEIQELFAFNRQRIQEIIDEREQERKRSKELKQQERQKSGIVDDAESSSDSQSRSNESYSAEIEVWNEEKQKQVEERIKQRSENQDNTQDQDLELCENFLFKLMRLAREQKKAVKEFNLRMQEDSVAQQNIDQLMKHMTENEKWFSQMSRDQSNLMRAILIGAFKDGQIKKESMETSQQVIQNADLKTLLQIIVTVGPATFRENNSAESLSSLQEVIQLVESAQNSTFLSLLTYTVECCQAENNSADGLTQSLCQQFEEATEFQRRVMLTLTNSFSLKKRWVEKSSPDQILALMRPATKTQQIDFSILSFCTAEQIDIVSELFDQAERSQLSAWQLKQSIGLPQKSYDGLKLNQRKMQRNIKLSVDTKYLQQIANPGKHGQVFRVEKRAPEFDVSYQKGEKERWEKNVYAIKKSDESQSDYFITELRYSETLRKFEPLSSTAIERPVCILRQLVKHLNEPLIFTSLEHKAFFFSTSQGSVDLSYKINILVGYQKVEQKLISQSSLLYDYIANGNLIMENEYGDKFSLPQAEPALKQEGDHYLVIFSYFKIGRKPSVCIYSTKIDRELVELEGSIMFVMDLSPDSSQVSDKDNSHLFLVYAPPSLCTQDKLFQDRDRMERYLNNNNQDFDEKLCYKKYAFNYQSLLKTETKKSVQFMSDYDMFKDAWAEADQPEISIPQMLSAGKSDYFYCNEQATLDYENSTMIRVINHTGPNGRRFFVTQTMNYDTDRNFTEAHRCSVIEVEGPNSLKLLYDDEGQFVNQQEGTIPNAMIVDHEKKNMNLIDLFFKSKDESTGVENSIVCEVLLPDELVSGEDISELAIYTQPILVNGLLLTSCQAREYEQFDLQIKKVTSDAESNHEQVNLGELSFTRLNAIEGWKYHTSYPLLACVNADRSDELVVTHMANGQTQLARFNLQSEQFISFVHLNSHSGESRVAFLSFKQEYLDEGTLILHQLRLQKSFEKNALMDTRNWSLSQSQLVKASYSKLFELRDKIKMLKAICYTHEAICQNSEAEAKVHQQDKSQRFAFLCQTDKEILFITPETVKVIFESVGDLQLVNQNMLFSQSGKNFFISQELSSQTSFINEISTKVDSTISRIKASCTIVHTFQSGLVLDIQLDRDIEQSSWSEYTLNDYESNPPTKPAQLLVLDSNLIMSKLWQENTGQQFKIVQNRNLSKLLSLKKALQLKQQDENATMCDRSITFRDKIYMIESGNVFDALNNFQYSAETILSSELVPRSDKIIHKVRGVKHLELVLRRDAGRRNSNPLGNEQLRDCQFAQQISKDLMLFKIRSRIGKFYFTLINENEEMKEVPSELLKILHDSLAKRQKLDGRIIDGNVCQLLIHLHYSGRVFYENNEPEQNLFNQLNLMGVNDQKAYLARLNSGADVICIKQLYLTCTERPAQYQDIQILQNYQGKLVEILTTKFVKQCNAETSIKPLLYPSEITESGQLRPTQVVFTEAIKGTKYIYQGEHLCWLSPELNEIKAIKISTYDSDKLVKTINFKEHIEKTPSHLIGISESNPFVSIRMAQSDAFDQSAIDKLANQIQLTLESRALTFDLNADNPLPINEIQAMDQLTDPQNFVDCGLVLSKVSEKKSERYQVKDFKIFRGNRPFGLEQKFEPQQQSDTYFVTQESNLPIQLTQENDLRFRPLLGIYKGFCEVDIMEVDYLLSAAQRGVKPKKIDHKTLWACIGSHSLLSLIGDNLRILTAIKESIQSLELTNLEDKDGNECYHPDQRRLNLQMMKKIYFEESIEEEKNEMKLKSLVQKSQTQSGKRDALLKIGRLSPQFSLMNVYQDQNDFKTMIETSTPQTVKELKNCFRETRTTRQLQLLDWPVDLHLLTHLSEKCTISKDDLENQLKMYANRVTRAVQVSTMSMGWFYKNQKNFVAFTKILQKLPHKDYDSIFVQSVLNEFWKKSQKKLIREQFLPYTAFVVASLWFFLFALDRERKERMTSSNVRWILWIINPLIILLWLYLARFELKQMVSLQKKRFYFKKLWNWNDIISLGLSIIILLSTFQPETLIPIEHLRLMAAIASCTLLVKMFDWLRLFESTAFYILLVEETIRDMRAFLILLLIAILMFGVPLIMLNMNRSEEDENLIIGDSFGYWGLDMIVSQYLLALGQFDLENFADQPESYLCYIFFLLATFITQVVMLNMLIAIMGDTFERVIENRDVNAIKTKLQLIGDLVATLEQKSSEEEMKKRFMFVVKPDDDIVDDNDDWEGTVNKVTRLTAANVNLQCEKLQKQTTVLQESLDEFIKKDVVQDRHLRVHVDKLIKSSEAKVFERIASLEETAIANQAKLRSAVELLVNARNSKSKIVE